MQLNPQTAQTTDEPTPVLNNGHLVMTYFVPSSITDINYVPQVSTDLVTWNSGSSYVQVISSVAGPGGTTITVQDNLPANATSRFMRLNVSQQ